MYEDFIKDARDYLHLLQQRSGPLPQERPVHYIWGQALDVFRIMQPDVKIINLETSMTCRGDPWPDKGMLSVFLTLVDTCPLKLNCLGL